MLSRRKFLGLAAGSAAGGTAAWAALLRDHVEHRLAIPAPANPTTTALGDAATGGAALNDRVLVIVQMGGGNDGLNTVVPSLGAYHDARPTLALPDAALVPIDALGYALHPSLAPLRTRWNTGQIAAFHGIGFRAQSRSHFKAMDTWWAGTNGAASTTGWLGRWLDVTEDDVANPLRSISLGTGAPALSGVRSVPTVVLDPAEFALRLPRGADAAAVTEAFLATSAPASPSRWLAAAQASVPSTLDAITMLRQVATSGDATSDRSTGAESDSATNLLQSAAGIVELGVGTRVILVGMNGFDTHADQLDRHAALLADLADGITKFFDRLEASGHADRVLLLTTSEFGRRVAENSSGGFDHGLGGAQFVVGPAVHGRRVVGEPALDRLVDGDMPIGIDARSLYAVGLDWLGGPTDELLGGRFDRYGTL